jgi:hypothetical protein
MVDSVYSMKSYESRSLATVFNGLSVAMLG